MKKKRIMSVILMSLLGSIIIGCNNMFQNTSQGNENKISVEDDVEIKDDYGKDIILKSKNYLKVFNGDRKSVSGSSFIGRVVADKDNISKIEKLKKTEDGQTVICYLDTTNSIDLKVGDIVSVEIVDNGSGKDETEFIYNAEPINEEEYNKTVAEITGDNRDKSSTDKNIYLKDEDGNMIFVPELSVKKLMENHQYIMTTRVLDEKYMNNIDGIFEGKIVLTDIRNGNIFISVNIDNNYEYLYISIDELQERKQSNVTYKNGDKVKVTIGTSVDFNDRVVMIQ